MILPRTARPAVAAALLAALAAAPAATASVRPAATRPSTRATVTTAGASTAACVPVRSWTTRHLAAQTVIVPVQETHVSGVANEVAHGAGGVILFGDYAPADLGTGIAALERSVPGRVGLLVMTDEEGGGVQRMANLVGNLPWARVMGTRWTPAGITRRVAAVATRMAGYHVTTDLAPVVDVDGRDEPPGPANPDGWRSFSGRTSVVTTDGLAYAHGLERGGVMPVLKHFPGLGGSSGNTDNGPATTLPWSRLMKVALPPFVAGIKDGVPAIMISNASVPGLTTQPASLSRAVIRTELVGRLGFHGLVVTDSLSAGAISAAGYSVPHAAVAAVRAGADMIMYSAASDAAALQQFRAVLDHEVAAVATGRLTRARLIDAATASLVARHISVCS